MPNLRKKTTRRKFFVFSGLLLAIFLVALGFAFVWVKATIGDTKNFITDDATESNLIYDRNGKLLYQLFTDKSRVVVPLSTIPMELRNATLAIEDANFYNHFGFDIRGILRGLFRTFIENRKQGGSTITQQLIKNTKLTAERTWERKIKEAVLTVAAEFIYTKEEILEMYFNRIPYGGTVWGAAAASEAFFGKSLGQLNLAQLALIAGLPASPTKYSPFVYPEKAKARQEQVLLRMKELKMIDDKTYEDAKNFNLSYSKKADNIKAPHFVFYVRNELIKQLGQETVSKGGLNIKTTLDLNIQDYAQAAVVEEIDNLNKKKAHVTNGAVLVTNPKNGEILAMVGSKDYFDETIDGQVNIVTSPQQPGSSIKPLNYAVAIDTGKITAATVFEDGPICFPAIAGQKPYCPTNYGNKYYGVQSVRNSLGNSLNIAAVKILKLNGVENFVASASAMGLTTLTDSSNYGLSLTLGAGDVYQTDMNVAFGVLASGGVRRDLDPFLAVTSRNDDVLYQQSNTVVGERVMSREATFIVTNILTDDGARSMVFGRGSMLNIKGHPEVAVKTGTTNDLRDNWTIGYTPDYIVSVWVGNSDNSKMSSVASGTTGASPIWSKIMTQILKDKPVTKMAQPVGVVQRTVCNLTGGTPPAEGCESKNEYFKQGFIPGVIVPSRGQVLVDKTTGKQVRANEQNPNAEMQEKTIISDPVTGPVCIDCSR